MIIVFPDCFTALGGNQYMNSSAVGRYADYLIRELIPFVDREFRTLASREHRGCFGKSSGGYGAMMHGMKYARHWGAIANHSGDAYFDFVYGCDWPSTLDELAKYPPAPPQAGAVDVLAAASDSAEGVDDGRVERFLESVWRKSQPSSPDVHCLMNLAMAATYDPDPAAPNGFRLPFDLETGELMPARWRQWLKPRSDSHGRASCGQLEEPARHLHRLRLARSVSAALRLPACCRNASRSTACRTATRSSTTPTPASTTVWIAACRSCIGRCASSANGGSRCGPTAET